MSASPSSTLPPRYRPADHENTVRERWESARAFHADPDAVLTGRKPPYSIFIPPPNVTARLHLGHALNNTLQDILARVHRMRGFEVLWMPGTDHAGIATQTVVEQRILKEEGRRRTDFTREQFVARIQAWKDEYEAAITDQLKAIGCSCDWDRRRFTMDDICARAVREAFFLLFKAGLIDRGKRLVNWDPATQTALADDEVEMEEIDGHFYYLRYPLVRRIPDQDAQPVSWSELARRGYPGAERMPDDDQAWITVATTRPETYLGDTAVAVNPKDPRAAALEGLYCELPLVGRVIPIIQDDYVVMPSSEAAAEPASGETADAPHDPKAKFATGFLKVTPAHDPNDYDLGLRHNLPIINVMAPDASISDKHGWTDVGDARIFLGLSREAARQKVVQEFKARGLLEKTVPYRHAVGHSYRSHVPIEPYLSDQWYCKATDDRLRGWALKALAALGGDSCGDSGGMGVPPVPREHTLTIHRRYLPHRQISGSTYFITFRVREGRLSDAERRIVLDACAHWHGDRAVVHLITVMPDHVHLLLTPTRKPDGSWHDLPTLVHGVKRFTSHKIQQSRRAKGELWQQEYFDRIIRDEKEFTEKWNYMVNNPVTAGLVSTPEEYPFLCSPVNQAGTGGTPIPPKRGGESETASTLAFFPERYAKMYQAWLENLRDWCISRQLWWGHQIPVWWAPAPDPPEQAGNAFSDSRVDIKRFAGVPCVCIRRDDTEAEAFYESLGFRRDPDVLDTWFSSALWPLSTLGWPDPPEGMKGLLEAFNPSAVLVTAREIITLWVSRMVMFNRYFLSPSLHGAGGMGVPPVPTPSTPSSPGPVPFRHVYINPVVQDGHGQRMSKSLGNGVDPLDIVHSHGADALRLVLCQSATSTQDVRMPVDLVCPHCGHAFEPAWTTSPAGYTVAAPMQTCPACRKKMVSAYGAASGSAKASVEAPLARNSSIRFDAGRNFCTKLWNAARFALMNLESDGVAGGMGVPPVSHTSPLLPLPDRWMLSRLARTIRQVNSALAEYQFARYAELMYDLLWRDFCDWYLEAVKPTVRSSPSQQVVLHRVLDSILRLLHPITPFVTEVLYAALRPAARGEVPGLTLRDHELLCLASWPEADASLIDDGTEHEFARMQALVEAIRQVRAANAVEPRRKVRLHADADTARAAASWAGLVESLAGLSGIEAAPPPTHAAPFLFEGRDCALSDLADAADADADLKRLTDALAKLDKDIAVIEARLANPGYVDKAPPTLVQQTRDDLARKQAERRSLRARLAQRS